MSEKNVNNVDQIRDLIFGSQIKDFEEQFNQVNNTLKILENKMTKAFNESHLKLQKETEHSLAVLEKKIDNLSSNTEKQRTKLKELIDTTDENLQEQLNSQKDKFTTKLKIIKENVADDNKKMTDNISAMQEEIQLSVEKRLATVSADKLSRDSIAQMFLDMAMNIQETDVSTERTKGAKSAK